MANKSKYYFDQVEKKLDIIRDDQGADKMLLGNGTYGDVPSTDGLATERFVNDALDEVRKLVGGGAQNVVWEENIGQFDIGELDDAAFFSYITELCIPEGVTGIKENFIESYRYDDGEEVSSYDRSRILYCTNLKKITFPSTLAKIPDLLFESFMFDPDPPKLEEVVISEGVQEIGSYVFSWCKKLSSVTIPSTVTTIGSGVFSSAAPVRITINKPENSIAGAPWGATNATVIWTG